MTAVILLSASFLLGGETIGDFRAWPPAAQSGYVLGFRSLAEDFAGIECEKKETIRETVEGLRTRKDFLPEMTTRRRSGGCSLSATAAIPRPAAPCPPGRPRAPSRSPPAGAVVLTVARAPRLPLKRARN